MAETLQEYLISLGYKVDADTEFKFHASLEKAGKALLGISKTLGITVAGIGTAVDEMSQGFEDLYYSAQRANSTASSLQAMRFGFTQIGLAAGQASASAEGLAASMRNNPGIAALVTMLTGRSVQGRDTKDVFNDLVARLRTMPTFLQTQYEQMLGLDPTAMYQVLQNDDVRRRSEEEHIKRLKEAGVDTDSLAQKSVNLQRDIGSLGDAVATAGSQFLNRFIGPVDSAVKSLTALQDKLTASDKTGLSGSMETILIGLLGYESVAALIKALTGRALPGLVGTGAAVPLAVGAIQGGLSYLSNKEIYESSGGAMLGMVMDQAGGMQVLWDPSVDPAFHKAGSDEDYIRRAAALRGIDPDIAVAVAKSEGLYSYAGDHGTSFGPYQLHYGGGLGDVFTKQTGLNARDPSTIHDQIDFALDQAARGGWGPWHGWKGDAFAGLGGAHMISQNNSTTINVQGSGDPHTTATAVAAAQSRVNADALRNLKGAVSVGIPVGP